MAAIATPERIRRLEPVHAERNERDDVLRLSRALHAREEGGSHRCRLVGPAGESVPVPEAVFHLLARVVEVLARGDAITVVPVGQELTTQQAADLLNVSRQYLVRLLDQGRIPYTRTGKHRRLRIDDVLAHKEQRDRERDESLTELARLSQELGGYKELK